MPNILFGECLKFLLSTLDISSSRLSKAINVDSSLVSRWIHGKRVPPYNSSYVERIALYLSNNVCNKLQEQQLNSFYLKVCVEEEVPEDVKDIIKKILLEAQGHSVEGSKNSQKENLINKDQSSNGLNEDKNNQMGQSMVTFVDLSSEDKVVFGTDNIVAVCRSLMESASKQNSKQSNIIYITFNDLVNPEHLSDQDIRRWYHIFLKIIQNGWNIILLLRLNTKAIKAQSFINCMIALIQTGKLMPYYIKNYDSITSGDEIIIVPEIGVLSCFSTNFQSHINSALYIKNKPAIRMYQSHFQGFIAKHALPLINIFSNRRDYSHYLADSEDDIGNRFLFKDCFSILTLPEHLYKKFLERRKNSSHSKLESMKTYRKRIHAFLTNIQTYEYKDVYLESSIKDIMKNRQFYLYSDEGIESIHVEVPDIIEYFENIIELLQRYDNYQIAFLPEENNMTKNMKSFFCLVKERNTVIFESNNRFDDIPEIYTSITEPTLVKTIYDYFIGI